jgi:hypothetical protein
METLKLLAFIPLIGLTIGFCGITAHVIREAVKDRQAFDIVFAISWPLCALAPVTAIWCLVLELNGIGPFAHL